MTAALGAAPFVFSDRIKERTAHWTAAYAGLGPEEYREKSVAEEIVDSTGIPTIFDSDS
jgi:hypothetical protein